MVESDDEDILTGLIAKGMRHVVEKSSHSDTEFTVKNEILNGLVPALFLGNSAVGWKFDQIWMAHGHDIPERLEATVFAVFESG